MYIYICVYIYIYLYVYKYVCISNPGQTFGASLADDVFNIPFEQMLHHFQLCVRSAAIVRHLHEHLYF